MEFIIAGLTIEIAVLWFFYSVLTNRIARIREENSQQGAEAGRPISTLITEFNHVSHVNIELLEEKIGEFKNLLKISDDKIRRMNMIQSDLELVYTRVQEKRKQSRSVPGYQRVYDMHREGKTLEEISSILQLEPDQVRLSLEMAEKKYTRENN